MLIVAWALVAINHPLNVWNFRLTWFVRLEVLSWLGLCISFGIGEEGNPSFLLCQMELVLVKTNYLLILNDQRVLSL